MLNNILLFCLKHRFLVLIATALVCALGFFVVRDMNVDVFPDLTAPSVTIMTEAHGMEAEIVEKLVTYKIETALNGAQHVRRIRSSSAAGISIVWVEFEWGTDIHRARQIVTERLPLVSEQLPSGVGTPTMAPVASIMGEVMLIGLRSDSLSKRELRTLADWEILPQLKSIGGIANIVVLGGEYKQYHVLADPIKLQQFGISLDQLHKKVEECNLTVSGGRLAEYGNEFLVTGSGRAWTIEDIASAVVKQIGNQTVTVRDVATVTVGAADKIGDASVNAQESVVLVISKQPNTNTLKLTEKLDELLVALEGTLPDAVTLDNHIFRQADFIETSIENLQQTLLEGALFVVIVLIVFLMNFRTTIISLLAIPVSLLSSVLVLYALDYTINTMSLGGMAIAIGVLVDDAIIDVENVFKRLRQNAQLPEGERKAKLDVVFSASLEIRSSITIATLIVIVAFVPLFFLSGMEGRLLQPLGIAFVTSVFASLFVAITLTPVLCSYLLNKESLLTKRSHGTRVEVWLQSWYSRLLRSVLKAPKSSLVFAGGLFIVSALAFSTLGRGFLPEFNEGSLVVSATSSPGISLQESNVIGRNIEKLLLSLPEVSIVTRRTGRAELYEHTIGVNASEIDVPYKLDGKTNEQFLLEVRELLRTIPGVSITVGQPIAHRIDHLISGTRANIAIKLFGDNLNHLYNLGMDIKSSIENVPGLADVALEQQIEVPKISIEPYRHTLRVYGMTIEDVLTQVEIGVGGEVAGEIFEGSRYFDVVVRLQKEDRSSVSDIQNLLISLPNGNVLPLRELAAVTSKSTPNSVSRENVKRKIVVSGNVAGRDLAGVVSDIQVAISGNVELPPGYFIEYGGQFENEQRASRLLLLSAIAAVLVIFALLYMEFGSLKLAVLVLANLPLAVVGGVAVIYFTTGIISIASTIGFISLFGIATRNGILLVSRLEDLRKEGLEGVELLLEGAKDRFNPILMTTFSTGLALIPLALKAGQAGSEIQSPMAVVILGGLTTATLLNLFVIPSAYHLVSSK